MDFLLWYDDSPKRTIGTKIADAAAAYQQRFGSAPTVALVNDADNAPASVAGVATRVERRVQRNTVQVGREE